MSESTSTPLIANAGPKVTPYEPQAAMTPPNVQQSFALEMPLPAGKNSFYESFYSSVGNCFGTIGAFPGCCCFPNAYQVVPQGAVGLISRFGKFYKAVDPGLHFVLPFVEKIQLCDIKIQVEDIPRQTVTTKDNVSIAIDSVLYWHITDPYVATFLVADVRLALMERTQTTLRQVLGTRLLQDAIENRSQIADEISELIEGPALAWGVRVESMLIKDMVFSQELQETLSSSAKQKRLAEAKVIQARAEVEAAKLMRQAADVLNTPAAMQIRYLDTMTAMARTSGSKVIFMPTTEPAVPAAAHAAAATTAALIAPLQQTITSEMASNS